MKAAEAAKVEIDISLIPPHVQRIIAAATISAMRRTQRENPQLWAKIEARAADIREGRVKEYDGI